MSSFNSRGEIETLNGLVICCLGKKKSGKSVNALLIARSFPGDMVVIDVAGDDGPEGPGVTELHGRVEDLPSEWPEHLRERKGERMILRYCPDAGSPTFVEDMDAVAGLAYNHSTREQPCALLIHEIGMVSPAGRTPPHMRRVYNHNRHNGLCLIACGPRAKTVEALLLHQADLVYVFEMPSKADRDRIAENIGYPADHFDAYCDALKMHEYLRYDANEEKPDPAPPGVDEEGWASDNPDLRLVHFPPLPEDVVKETERWAHNVPKPIAGH